MSGISALLEEYVVPEAKLTELLRMTVNAGGSDLHIMTNTPPRMRLHGALRPIENFEPLTKEKAKELIYSVLVNKEHIEAFERDQELDVAVNVEGLSRFRVNVFGHHKGIGAAFRVIPYEIVPLEDLNVPKPIADLTTVSQGLCLVTGPTGSGKSTTLASLLDQINRSRDENIITVEDPVEFIHNHKRCQVVQREVKTNTKNFASAVRNGFRQDPDVVLIGELRDLETIEQALLMAETGHLTFATLHTNSAPSTITRIVNVFPGNQQPQIRTQLSNVLIGVLSQQLLPRADGTGRVMAAEAMIPTHAIRNLIREDKIQQIHSTMANGQDETGMVTMNQSLARLVTEGVVNLHDAQHVSPDQKDLNEKINYIRTKQRGGPTLTTLRPVPSQRPGVERRV